MKKIKARVGDVLLIIQTTNFYSTFDNPETLSRDAMRGWNEALVVVQEVQSNFIRGSVTNLCSILFNRSTGVSFFGRSLIVDNLGPL